MTASLYDNSRKKRSLYNAWRVVHSNGVTSKSDATRKLINEFSDNTDTHLNRICKQLREKRFNFLPSEGILQTKPGKSSKRPIVLSPIENRIVQRAILDTLQTHPPLKKYFTVATSFGGIKDRGVSDALQAVYTSIQAGAKYFIRSDIESFFTQIPKPTITRIIEGTTTDKEFLNLFEKAIQVELSNLDELGKNKDTFPIYDIGVAQGSCLSPLLGNILLSEFDIEMNKGDITCIRYIDDFIILAPSQKAVLPAPSWSNRKAPTPGLFRCGFSVQLHAHRKDYFEILFSNAHSKKNWLSAMMRQRCVWGGAPELSYATRSSPFFRHNIIIIRNRLVSFGLIRLFNFRLIKGYFFIRNLTKQVGYTI